MLGKLADPLMKVAVPSAENVLTPLATMASASAIYGAVKRKMRMQEAIFTNGAGIVRAGKGITKDIWNQDMDDLIRIIKSLENSGILIDEVSERVKHKIKK